MTLALSPQTRDLSVQCIVGGGLNNKNLTLLEWLADPNNPHVRSSYRRDGWKILDPDSFEAAAEALHVKFATVKLEVTHLGNRGTLEVKGLGDGQYIYRLTKVGEERLAAVRATR